MDTKTIVALARQFPDLEAEQISKMVDIVGGKPEKVTIVYLLDKACLPSQGSR